MPKPRRKVTENDLDFLKEEVEKLERRIRVHQRQDAEVLAQVAETRKRLQAIASGRR